ncbi:hypothetical protein H0H92_009798 [Tricholoma furcatifolium]|nr:hypothetical protein H0H92_009798 [Tricholoma furcatifolium]
MVIFAALSNTLLLTILISLLSNTVARIEENATQEYLFQFAIATMEGVKSDALFSYQPPFNILAFLILKPATYILSPRALHSFNVFLIKLTSLPVLIVIGIYERYFAHGMRFADTGREAAQSFFKSLPRHIKHMPLVEALVGSASNDIYDAIFEVEISSELDPFDESDDEGPILRSFHSREDLPGTQTPRRRRVPSSTRSPTSVHGSPRTRPNLQLPPPLEPFVSSEAPQTAPENTTRSPLAMLFGSRISSADGQAAAARAEAAVRRVESMMEDLQLLPVQKLREEMKDLQANCRAPTGPWDNFNYAPSSRTVRPKFLHSSSGKVQAPEQLVPPNDGSATFIENGSYIVLDFGQEVGGMVSFTVDNVTADSSISLSFTESPEFISPLHSDDSCRAVSTMNSDGVQLLESPLSPGTFTQTIGEQRGGFRYLTILSNNKPVTISNVSVQSTWMPHWDDLRAYNGYFFALDPTFHDPDFLTKLWYAGAYTVQTNTLDPHQARQQPCPSPTGWANNASGGPVDGPILVDGAKRDRNIWPGDMGISSHTELVALNDLLPTKNSLTVMFSTQDPATGSLQYSGPPINAVGSDTYIGWTLIGTHTYYLYTGDLDFVQFVWENYTKAVAFLEGQVDTTGLMDVPLAFSNDWGRDNGQGYNSAANAILYQASCFPPLCHKWSDPLQAQSYTSNATSLKATYNSLLWDEAVGLFRDNPTSDLHPQDGNSLAVLFNVTNQQSQNAAISQGLTNFWTDMGPLSPELNDTIIPFVSGFEVHFPLSHFDVKADCNSFKLILLQEKVKEPWISYTESTLLEGFTRNGSLGYRGAAGYNFDSSYTSHSHGWATGPTPALTFFVLGLTLTSAQGATWSVAPVLSGLDAAEGGLTTGLGWFGVKWGIQANQFTLTVNVPEGTEGVIHMPGTGSIKVDGELVSTAMIDNYVEIHGGTHTVVQSL